MLEWMLLATGFTGALSLVFFVRGLGHRFGIIPSVTPHFSPKGGCTAAIIEQLKLARREILVQAYSFSCPVIAVTLMEARSRGVTVRILLDRANEKETYSELGVLEEKGLEVMIDAHHAIAHNKIIIIDRRTLITGSFNFTRQAELENAENLLIIKGHYDLIETYAKNFQSHREHCQAPGTALAQPVRAHTETAHSAHHHDAKRQAA